MKTVGNRKLREISEKATGELLKQGALFNDELHKLPTGNTTYIRKGVYRYSSHEEANSHQERCVVEGMAEYAKR